MTWFRSKASRPALRGSLSAGASPQLDPGVHTRPRGPSDATLVDGDPGAEPGKAPQFRRASSLVHFKDEADAASSATTLASSQDLKHRQPYTQGSPAIGSGGDEKDSRDTSVDRRASTASRGTYKQRVSLMRRQSREIFEHIERKPLVQDVESMLTLKPHSLRGPRQLHPHSRTGAPLLRRALSPHRVAARLRG